MNLPSAYEPRPQRKLHAWALRTQQCKRNMQRNNVRFLPGTVTCGKLIINNHGNMLTITKLINYNYFAVCRTSTVLQFRCNGYWANLITLANWIWVGTLYWIKPQVPQSKYRSFYTSNWCLFLLSKLTSSVTTTTTSVPRSSMLIQYTSSTF